MAKLISLGDVAKTLAKLEERLAKADLENRVSKLEQVKKAKKVK